MKIKILSFILFLSFEGQSQMIGKEEVVNDLVFFNEAINSIHPSVLYSKREVDAFYVIDSLQSLELDSINYFDYRFMVEKLVQSVGCVHTSYEGMKTAGLNDPTYFPLRLFVKDKKVFTTDIDSSGDKIEELLTINNVPVRDVLEYCEKFLGSDGGATVMNDRFLLLSSSILISMYFHYPKEFEFTTIDNSYKMAAQEYSNEYEMINHEFPLIFKTGINQFEKIGEDIVLFKLTEFIKDDLAFYKNCFRYIEMNDIDTIVIDIRDNLGGDRDVCAKFTQYLLQDTFSYSIIQPKVNPNPYLALDGKRDYYYSKLFYNVFDRSKKVENELGQEFKYVYAPKSKKEYVIVVLTDSYTASSATMLSSWLKQNTNAKFVGAQSAGGYNGNNGGVFPLITLPGTKTKVKFPLYRIVLDENSTQDTGVIPVIPVEYEFEDILNKRDLEIDFILKWRSKKNV